MAGTDADIPSDVMTDAQRFVQGDRVVHPRRPEWGEGVVEKTAAVVENGQRAQKLTVRFGDGSRRTINTAVATLTRPGAADSPHRAVMTAPPPEPEQEKTTGGWLAALERKGKPNAQILAQLPDAMIDPFRNNAQRLEATLESYRFDPDAAVEAARKNPRFRPNPFDSRYVASGRKLLDWAIAQTGLKDPLSVFSRHEIEDAWSRFAQTRDQHLKDLVYAIKKSGSPETLTTVRDRLKIDAAKAALDWANQGR